MNELTSINTADEVAKYLKISTSTVKNLIRDKKLRSIKYLGKIRITKEAVEEFINT